jgi:hypothetical protein
MSTIAPTQPNALAHGRSSGLRAHAPEIAFAALLVLGVALVMVETRGMSFFLDDWDFVLNRRGLSPHVLLTPHGPHLVLIPILVYKAILQIFGAGTYVPFRLLAAFDLVVLAAALEWVCRSLWGRWWGLAPVLLLVTLGPGGITTLWSFQVGFLPSVAAGLVALMYAGREGRAADAICCGALLVSLASASPGIGFLVGAGVIVALREDRWRRCWVILVPLVLYGLWYLGYGHQNSQTDLSLWKLALPYTMKVLAATASALVGLSSVSDQAGTVDYTYGVPIAVAIVAGVGVALWRGWRPPPLFWGAAATFIVLAVAACLSNTGPLGGRPPEASRYTTTYATLLLVCVCTAVPAPRPARAGVILACCALAVVSATNAPQYGSARAVMYPSDVATRAELGALLILRGQVGPDFMPESPQELNLTDVRARPFYDAVDSFGMMTDSTSSIRAQPDYARVAADNVLLRGGVTFAPRVPNGGGASPGRCVGVGAAPLVFRAGPGTYRLTAGRSALDVVGARFADAFAAQVGSVAPSTSARITIKHDRASGIPWRLRAIGGGGRVCRVG